MPMTKAQQEYAIRRISEIHQKAVDSIRQAHLIPAVTLSTQERWDLVKEGKVSLLKDYQPDYYNRWYDIFDFSSFERTESFSDEGQKLIDAEKQRFQNAKDQIMLGDATEAMNIVSNY